MNSKEIREKFLKFFESKGHTIVPSSSLVTDDPSVLFTTAGMQQFKPYYIGKGDALKDFGSLNTASSQKCVRTSDIEEVGDATHLTFFEMLGNFSFGGYWKREAIEWAHEFVTKEMGLKIDYVSIFKGEDGVPEDKESEEIWRSIDPSLEIKKFGREDNFWGPTGNEGPCGPTTEIYVDGVEIWNIVFNEFYQHLDKTLKPLETKGVDTGMGLERLVKVAQGVETVFDTDLLKGIDDNRIVADHMRTSVFMIADGVRPSNTDQGYVLRRLLRRAIVNNGDTKSVISRVIERYKDVYDLESKEEEITNVVDEEEKKFKEALLIGRRQLEKGEDPFTLFTSYGFPLELTREIAKERGIEIDEKDFEEKFKKHQEVSKAGMEERFKGGLLGHSDIEIKYHTATHLLHQALHDVLGDEVEQRGSNITPERLRFDFSFSRKMTDEEKKEVEDIVNKKISMNLPVHKVVLPREEAEKTGARHVFGDKYGDEVSVYYIGDSLESAYSKEFCGGPHVENTGSIGKIKIVKEESSSLGVRRIKAVII